MYPHNIFKQHEYLNDLYRTHPQAISLEAKKALFESPIALFLLSRAILLHDYGIHEIFLKRNRMILPISFFTIITSLKL